MMPIRKRIVHKNIKILKAKSSYEQILKPKVRKDLDSFILKKQNIIIPNQLEIKVSEETCEKL